MTETNAFSLVIPARNEAASLENVLPIARNRFPDAEIIVVNDGSFDETSDVCRRFGAKEIRHAYGMGNGAAIKSGARAATHSVLVFMDGDGQHDARDIPTLLEQLACGYDMVVGARSYESQASMCRSLANRFYNRLASWMTGHKVADLTSGFRAARTDKFLEFLHLLPNGFSYPTTSTMAFFRAGYSVGYVPTKAAKRLGKSHIRPLHDGARFLLIIFKVGTLYSPLKLFCPVSATFFFMGLTYYLYTYLTAGRFTNMSALMFTTSVVIFLIGLVSEQITQLVYQPRSSQAATRGVSGANSHSSQQIRRTGT